MNPMKVLRALQYKYSMCKRIDIVMGVNTNSKSVIDLIKK